MSVAVLDVAPASIRVLVEHLDVELRLWIDSDTAFPVVRDAVALARAAAPPAVTEAGVWLTPGGPVAVGQPRGAWTAIAYPPAHTAREDDYALAFDGFVPTAALARSFVRDREAASFPPWALALRDGGIGGEVRVEAAILDRPHGARIATISPTPYLGVAVLEVRDQHRRVALDTGEVGVLGWIAEEAFIDDRDHEGSLLGREPGGTRVAVGTCLFDDAGFPVGAVTRDVAIPLDRTNHVDEPTPWGTIEVHVEPLAGGTWRACPRPARYSGGRRQAMIASAAPSTHAVTHRDFAIVPSM